LKRNNGKGEQSQGASTNHPSIIEETMHHPDRLNPPAMLGLLQGKSEVLDFRLASEPLTGCLLRTLAASMPAGVLLELGTGTGVATAWLLDGMNPDARLASVDQDASVIAVARHCFADDPRVTFYTEDAAALLGRLPEAGLDLIFADAWVGKYTHLQEALRLLKPGGLYVVDDMLPQAGWSDDHREKGVRLIAELEQREDLTLTKMAWSTGVIIAVKRR
jgi:predicted O-methyltransferase YrrM